MIFVLHAKKQDISVLLCRVKVLSLSGKRLYVSDIWELAEGCRFDRDIDVVQVCTLHILNCIRHRYACKSNQCDMILCTCHTKLGCPELLSSQLWLN